MSIGRLTRLVGGLLGVGLICTACGGTATKDDGGKTSCTPGTKRCDGHDVKRCDDNGSGESVWQTCSGATCQVQNGVPSCVPTTCAPGLGVCDGTVATTCNQDGSALLSGGTDCSDSGQYCVEGQCRDTLCKGGTKSCKDGDVYLCAADGQSRSLSQACGSNEVCSDESGTCLSRICTPNESVCFDDVISTCNSLGSGWQPERTDCSSQGKICVDGNCQSLGCTPSTPFCRDNKVYLCDPMGVTGSLDKVCDAKLEHCQESAGGLYASCVKNDCVARQTACVGNTIKTCNADNTLPDVGIDCQEGEFCEDAQCKPRDCTLGVPFCKDNDVYNCLVNGPALERQCEPTTTCQVIAEQAAGSKDPNLDLIGCIPFACSPGQIGCVENKIGSCNSQGMSLSGETIDCQASGQVCATDLTCVTSVTDVIGEDSQTEIVGNRYLGNVIDVYSARKLTALEIWLRRSTAYDLRWIVFEQVGNEFVAMAETTVSIESGTGFVSSGALSYQLEAGKRYALGAVVPEDGVAQNVWGGAASFGQVIGSAMAVLDSSTLELASSFAASSIYMKVTTEAP